MNALALLMQELVQEAPETSMGNEWFFDLFIWLIVLVPTAIVIGLAALKKKSKPVLPHIQNDSFVTDVTNSPLPVVVHAYQSWSIGDRVIEAQVEKIATQFGDRVHVFWMDVDECPDVAKRFPTLGEKSVALFIDGDLKWQSYGVHDHMTMWREIEPLLPAQA